MRPAMTVPRRTACPRCGASVAGDFKFCPACAYRLRPGTVPTRPPPPVRLGWPQVLVLAGAALLVSGILVFGVQLFGEPSAVSPLPPEPSWPGRLEEVLTVDHHLLDIMVDLPEFTAIEWLDAESGLYLPVLVGGMKMTRYEITRGMYAECVRDCEATPDRIPQRLEAIWRPSSPADYAYARGYLDSWWRAVAAHLSEDLDRSMERPADLDIPLPRRYGVLPMVPPSWTYLTDFEEIGWRLEEDTENYPVTEISWHDARGFAEWASQRIGEPLRLPLEVEWYRAGHGSGLDWKTYRYPWGEDALRYACNNLNFWGEIDFPRVQTVDYRYSQRDGTTPEGLWAMSGNAAEWAMDWIAVKQHNGTPEDATDDFFVAQVDLEPRADAPTMGGSFRDGIGDCTVDSSSVRRLDKRTRRDSVGFRLWMRSFDVLPIPGRPRR